MSYQLRQLRTVARSLTASATVLPLLPTPLSPIGLTILVPFTLASRLVHCGAWTRSCVLQSALLAAFPNLITSLDTCMTFSIGSPLYSESHTEYLPWSGAPFRASPLLIFVNFVALSFV